MIRSVLLRHRGLPGLLRDVATPDERRQLYAGLGLSLAFERRIINGEIKELFRPSFQAVGGEGNNSSCRSAIPVLMLTAADRLDDKASGFELGADDYLTKPFELRELVLRLRALDRRPAHNRPPVREIAGLRLDPFRREVYRDGRYVALTRKQFAVLEVLVAAEGGVVSAEELLGRAWDENADPFTNAVRITVSALRKRLGEPWVIATVAGVGYCISLEAGTGHGRRSWIEPLV